MLPEIILDEEENLNYRYLFGTGLLAGLAGFAFGKALFPGEASLLAPVFASLPLVYPLMQFYMEKEEEFDYFRETSVYAALFSGLAVAFFAVGVSRPEFFSTQLELIGVTGNAANPVSFAAILFNNLTVQAAVFGSAFILGSAGAFILAWNASVLGAFFAHLVRDISNPIMLVDPGAGPLAYVPHASLEMTGFIIAGVVGTTASSSVYRKHLGLDHWLELAELYLIGLIAIVLGAGLEAFNFTV